MVPEVLEDLATRLDAIERTLTELRQAADSGFGRLERRLIQLVQVLVARQSARERDR